MNSSQQPSFITATIIFGVAALFLGAKPSNPADNNAIQAKNPKATTVQVTPPSAIWFGDVQKSPGVRPAYARTVTAYVRQKLLNPKTPAMWLPASLKHDFHPRIVFITVSDGVVLPRISMGSALGLIDAANQALDKIAAISKSTSGQTTSEKTANTKKTNTNAQQNTATPFKPRWIKVDIVATVLPQATLAIARPLDFERSLFGIAFDRNASAALLPAELTSNNLVNYQQNIFASRIENYLLTRLPAVTQTQVFGQRKKFKCHRFTTLSYFADQNNITPLYRGHKLHQSISKKQISQSARDAANYLTQAVSRLGQFDYIHRPDMDKPVDDYNITRHFAAVAALADAVEANKNPAALAAAKRAITYADESIGTWKQQGQVVPCVVDGKLVKLGANAMACLAYAKLAKVTQDKTFLKNAKDFALAISIAQQENGSFTQTQGFPAGNSYNHQSPIYPSQAICALLQTYKVDANPRWLNVAHKAATHIINIRDKETKLTKQIHDHWLCDALNQLHRLRPNQIYINHAMRIAKSIYTQQNRKPKFTDWLGSYYQPPGSTATATRTLALTAVYQLARDYNHPKEATQILEAILLGTAFQLQCQFQPETAMYFKNPGRVIGGFRESLTSQAIRIDFVQHNMVSLLNLYKIMDKQGINALKVPKAQLRVTKDQLNETP